jgi:crotonobetainyl-CoA:carnitine CoA-transferase CaiB-like acyl-CoA transferase
MRNGVRYQFYATKDGHILFQASEREFWENFCKGIERADLFEKFPGAQYADHAVGNIELRSALRDIFASRTSAEWVQLGERVNTPIVNVNTPQTLADDPQFQDRFPWLPRDVLGAEQLASPIKLIDEALPVPSKAPTVGQHTDEVLREVLGYDEDKIASLRASGALG